MSQDVRDTLRAHGWEPIVDSSGVEQWRSPCSSRACWSIEAAAAQLCSEQSRPSQSANARPCNCDQALKAEREAGRLRGYERSFHRLDGKLLDANMKLDTITRILCDLVSAPSLSVAQFADPTLERIRLAMLGRGR